MLIAMLQNNVLLELDAVEDKKGVIYIPETAKDAPQTATVVAVGPGRWNSEKGLRDPMFVEPGDRVVFPKYAGSSIELDGRSFIIVKELDLSARIVPPQELSQQGE